MLARDPTSPSSWQVRAAMAARHAPLLLLVIPAVWLGLAAVGVVRGYSPVPYWDMWDDYVRAYLDFDSGHWRAFFFHQANEHRLVFSKATFALDIAVFGGRSQFLFAFNLALMAALWLTFAAIARQLLRGHGDLWLIVACGLAAPALSWLHESNLTWAFQGQFFLAYLVPLLAFFCLARALEDDKLTGWFAGAMVLGLCAMGTMANGLFAMPLMALMLVFGGRPFRARLAILIAIYAAVAAFWFRNYVIIPRARPAVGDIVTFLQTFYGAPIQSLTGHPAIAKAAGVVLIVGIASFAIYWLHIRRRLPVLALAIVAFCGFLGASGATISWGRAGINPDATIVPRYQTPALLAWCTFLLIIAYTFRNARHARAWHAAASVAIAYFCFSPERSTVKPYEIQKRNLAGLAIQMDIFDLPALAVTYPTETPEQINTLKNAVQTARDYRMAMFGYAPWLRAVGTVGASSGTGFHQCLGSVDTTAPIKDETRFRRVGGWAFDKSARKIPLFVHVASGGKIVGVAVTGALRRDVAEAYDQSFRATGFDGYVDAPEGAQLELMCAD